MHNTKLNFGKPSDLLAWSFDQDLGSPETNAVLAQYYATFVRSFGPLRRRKYDLQLESLTDLVRSGRVKSVLDVGCGCGTVSLWLSLQGAATKGIDLQADRLVVARTRASQLGLNTEFRLQNLFEEERTYDAIWLEQAFHHVEPRDDAYEHLTKILNPGGYIVISEANAWNPMLQLQLLRRRGVKTIRQHIDDNGKVHVYGDERVTTPAVLTRGFARHGVRREDSYFFGVLPNNRLAERTAWIEDVIPRYFPPVFTHYLWVGRKI